VFPDPDGGNATPEGEPVVDGIGLLNKRRAAPIRSSRLEPLLKVAQAAAILNVSERTVRRLIASGTIRGIWISRSVRLRPLDIERWITGGGTCDNWAFVVVVISLSMQLRSFATMLITKMATWPRQSSRDHSWPLPSLHERP
jgi:excisionase family DNA binding protein